jgi:hypothetical protein
MNRNSLTETEASYLLFAFKAALRDRENLTPNMIQFYESNSHVMREKLLRIQNVEHSDSYICDV